MEVTFRLAKKSDLPEYTDLLQKTYEQSYTDDSLGLTKDCFSKEIFNNENTQTYLASNIEVNEKQKAWLAFEGNILVGSISIIDEGNECQLRGFYVRSDHQGKGIGKNCGSLLWSFLREKISFLICMCITQKRLNSINGGDL